MTAIRSRLLFATALLLGFAVGYATSGPLHVGASRPGLLKDYLALIQKHSVLINGLVLVGLFTRLIKSRITESEGLVLCFCVGIAAANIGTKLSPF